MLFYRCKCGEHTATASMAIPDCHGCDKCGTTLATSPHGHQPIQPHDLGEPEGRINPRTMETWKVRRCRACWNEFREYDEPPTVSPTRAEPTGKTPKT